ncbi:hypothetical protein SAMN06298212_11830 [Ruaniaceae bacterium KH17]|nr:hypothetical protein SAMN06298212_11830 [Ruaniaceae bacterium KH17]
MTESPESAEPPKKPSRLKRAAKAYSYVSDIFTPQRIGLLLGALLLLAVGVFGGWGAVGDAVEDVEILEVGQSAETSPFTLTPSRARVFDELAGVFYAEDGYRYIAVLMTVENTTDTFVSTETLREGTTIDAAGVRTIELEAGPRVIDAEVRRGIDGLSQPTFQPGLPTEVVLAWQQAVTEPIPDEITIGFSDFTWRTSTLDGSMGWRDAVPAAQFVLPLEPLDEP